MSRWNLWGTKPAAAPDPRAALPGQVEGLGPRYLWGWAAWQGTRKPRLTLRLDGEVFPAHAQWVARPDFAGGVLARLQTPGFRAYMPLDVMERLVADPSRAASLEVLLDGIALPVARPGIASAPDAADWRRFPQGIALALGRDVLHAETWAEQPFRVHLRFFDGETAPQDLRLACGGEPLDGTRWRRAADDGSVLFEFELPGSVWQVEPGTPFLKLHFLHGESRFPAQDLELPVTQGFAWLDKQSHEGPHDTYEQMLALEHAHFLSAHGMPGAEAQAYLAKIAAEYKLEDYLPGAAAVPEGVDTRVRPKTFWRAVREFNDRLPQWQGREDRLLEEIGRPLGRDERSEFIEHVAPFFFRIGRFDVIRPHVSLERAEQLASWADTFTVSMSLPFFVADGQVDRAAEVIYSFKEKKGWLSTDALSAASRYVARDIPAFPDHEKFAYAVIGLIDGMAADYWSRHQDLELMRALSAWLAQPALLSSWMLRDVTAAVIRNYALSEEFWASAVAGLDPEQPLLQPVFEARRQFEALRAATAGEASARWTPALRETLAYFRRAGCHDLPRVLRELLAARMLAHGSADDDAGPLQDMLSYGVADAVRIAALPTDAPVPAACLPGLRQSLVGMQGDIERASHYALQCRLGRAVREVAANAGEGLDIAFDARMGEVDLLDAGGNFRLAADVLARLRVLATRASRERLIELQQRLLRCVEAGLQEGAALPYQPLLAALSWLRRHADSDLQLAAVLRRATGVLGKAYAGDRLSIIGNALAPPADLRLAAPKGHDTLVVVYSCRPYLDTRVQAMRDTWLQDLRARGIPFVVVVGDGDDTLKGDVLALAVPDDYEDLPAKTLAMVRWVARHTDFQYLLKIDDDCFLNVDEYFDSQSYRKFHYYGRAIKRPVGGTDRQWHQGKSRGARARNAIDKSPEPSQYADGGGGYTLSRLAMLQVLAQSGTEAGRRLIASSFMEDKLVGDLLAPSGIRVANEDYYTLIRRRFGSNARPVAIWDNTFLPSAWSPVKLVHLDTADAMAPTRATLHEPVLLPKKLFPGHSPASLWHNKQQLELLTPLADVQRLSAEPLFVVLVVRNEMTMLPHFLAHYRAQGVRAFIVVDNISDDGSREHLLAQPDVILYSADGEYRESTFGVSWQQTVLAHHCLGKWALVADADEFLVYPGCETRPLTEVVADVGAAGYDAVRVDMVDMYPFGDLADADFRAQSPFEAAPWHDREPLQPRWLVSGFYSNAPNFVSSLRHRQMPFADPDDFTSQKYCLVRYAPWMRFPAGLHNVANARIAPEPLAFAHFKYHAGFKAKVEQEVSRKQHYGGAQEYRKYLGMLAEGQGGFGREDVSVRYAGSDAFIAAVRACSGQKGR